MQDPDVLLCTESEPDAGDVECSYVMLLVVFMSTSRESTLTISIRLSCGYLTTYVAISKQKMEGGEDHQRRRYPIMLPFEIAVVHSSILLAWKFLLPYMPHYLTDCKPLLDFIWTHILEPYAVSLFSIPSVVVLLIMLCYIAAKYKFAKDIFNVEGMYGCIIVIVSHEDRGFFISFYYEVDWFCLLPLFRLVTLN